MLRLPRNSRNKAQTSVTGTFGLTEAWFFMAPRPSRRSAELRLALAISSCARRHVLVRIYRLQLSLPSKYKAIWPAPIIGQRRMNPINLKNPEEAADKPGAFHRLSCPVVRFYVAKYSAGAAESWARSSGATDGDIETARRCLSSAQTANVAR
jgi:hypothetical protein